MLNNPIAVNVFYKLNIDSFGPCIGYLNFYDCFFAFSLAVVIQNTALSNHIKSSARCEGGRLPLRNLSHIICADIFQSTRLGKGIHFNFSAGKRNAQSIGLSIFHLDPNFQRFFFLTSFKIFENISFGITNIQRAIHSNCDALFGFQIMGIIQGINIIITQFIFSHHCHVIWIYSHSNTIHSFRPWWFSTNFI